MSFHRIKGKYHEHNADHIYVNAIISNQTNSAIEARYNTTRSQPVLENPSEYYLTIARFSVPGSLIPLFVFEPGAYSFTLGYNGNYYTQVVDFIPKFTADTNNPFYYYVGSYEHMIEMFNQALLDAFIAAQAAEAPALDDALVPYFTYDSTTQLISLFAPKPFFEYSARTSVTGKVLIYMNRGSLNKLGGIEISSVSLGDWLPGANPGLNDINTTDRLVRFIVRDSGDNSVQSGANPICERYQGGWNANTNTPALASSTSPGGIWWYTVTTAGATNLDGNTGWVVGEIAYFNGVSWEKLAGTNCLPDEFLRMRQQFNELAEINDFKNLVFTTNMIPVAHEYVPASGADLKATDGTSEDGFRSVLTDFEPSLAAAGDFQSTLQYFPSGPYRLVDLHGTHALSTIDLQIFWQNRKNELFPVNIAPGQVASVKLLFIKKDVYNPLFASE